MNLPQRVAELVSRVLPSTALVQPEYDPDTVKQIRDAFAFGRSHERCASPSSLPLNRNFF